MQQFSLLHDMSEDELIRLRETAALFLYKKTLNGAGDLEISDDLRLMIAVFASIPILNLGLDYYQGWVEVIVYPGAFRTNHEYTAENGVVHVHHEAVAGEAWLRGPVILSAGDIAESVEMRDGFNVVIHEMAHKLDMLTGEANGCPPLHKNMSHREWSETFNRAYDQFCDEADRGMESVLDPYAAEDPAEFFAVLSETFFEIPQILLQTFPDVYAQLKMFYRQDPAARIS